MLILHQPFEQLLQSSQLGVDLNSISYQLIFVYIFINCLPDITLILLREVTSVSLLGVKVKNLCRSYNLNETRQTQTISMLDSDVLSGLLLPQTVNHT